MLVSKARTLIRLLRHLARIPALEEEVRSMHRELREGRTAQGAQGHDHQEARGSTGATSRAYFDAFLNASADGNFVRVSLNGAALWVPVSTLRTMVHCLSVSPDGGIDARVELDHLRWMMRHLEAGGTFLDVGAATGATTLPVACQFGSKVRIVAYEPAIAARELLLATIDRNQISGVVVRPVAVSERAGEAQFREYLPDSTGQTPFLPEASSIVADLMPRAPHSSFTVPVVTLDEDAMPLIGARPIVCKIDVEGFEAFVLRGAVGLLSAGGVYLSIDIHADPFGDGTRSTESDVRQLLSKHGYNFEKMNHVLLCTPDLSRPRTRR